MKNSKEENDSSIDRLSNLPEAVIHHILSFLDTKSAVQTSVLSRQWKSSWKYLAVLEFDGYGMWQHEFERYVNKVLSLRYHQLNLNKLIFRYYLLELDTKPENSLLAKVIRYALSHRTQHLEIHFKYLGSISGNRSAHLIGFNSDNSDLKTLELSYFRFRNRFRWSGFLVLETLDLVGCTLSAGREHGFIDPFSSLPCLKHLGLTSIRMINNNADAGLRVSGLQLLSLRLSCNQFHKMEIHAPKLKRLTLDHLSEFTEFTELNLPSVDHANVLVRFLDDVYNEGEHNECIKQQIIPLFVGLKNATSLGLSSFTARLLGDISDYLEEQPSPFTRLKSLILESMRDGVPFAVVNHLLKGSSAMKPVVKFTSQL
ncbi:Putative F-box/LRR-repeat protein At5g02930 [Linum grandiflorum]